MSNVDYSYSTIKQNVDKSIKSAYKDYLVYTGTNVDWYSENKIIATYNATSGLPNYQNANYQNLPNKGPIPAGTYNINLSLNYERYAEVYDDTGELKSGQGIQRIPESYTSTKGIVYSYPGWGTVRARLEPVSGNMYGRHSFYIHDSHKGYTHGCIEVDGTFFNRLIDYSFSNSNIKMYVRYPSYYSSTYGGTFY